MTKKNVTFASKMGLIATTVGSAVGLGNIWRFPAEAQAGGGAAFLFLYIACVVLLGIPVMVAEMSLGRAGRSDAIGAFRNISHDSKWWIVGLGCIVACYLIMSFYMVIEGWTAAYLWESLTGGLYEGVSADTTGEASAILQERMRGYISDPWFPLITMWVVTGINAVILLGGVKKGLERISNVLMPMLFGVLLLLCFVTLSLPGAGAGLEFFLRPDFSKITSQVVIGALGQTFFSLSLGMGILITYAGYYPGDTHLLRTSGIVGGMSILVGLLMGFIIFPAVMSFNLTGESLEGTTLVFVTLPEVFAAMGTPQLWSSLFFLLLLVAALTSTMSGLEVVIRFLQDRTGMNRVRACLISVSLLVALSTLCCLSFGPLKDYTIGGLTIFSLLELISTDIMLPVISICLCLYMGWFAPKGLLRRQLTNEGTIPGREVGVERLILRYFAPFVIVAILLARFI